MGALLRVAQQERIPVRTSPAVAQVWRHGARAPDDLAQPDVPVPGGVELPRTLAWGGAHRARCSRQMRIRFKRPGSERASRGETTGMLAPSILKRR